MTKTYDRRFKADCFASWYRSLSWTEIKTVRRQLCDRLDVTRQTINNYYTGKTEIPCMAMHVINDIANRDIFTK